MLDSPRRREGGLSPRFVFDAGCPDLKDERGSWIEAKMIRTSDADRAAWELAEREARVHGGLPGRGGVSRDVSAGLLNKFDSVIADAVRKWRRQGSGSLTVYVSVTLDVDIESNEAFRQLECRASRLLQPGLRILATQYQYWQEPRLDVSSP